MVNEGREYKWQIDIKGGVQMFHLRTDTLDDIKTLTGLQNVSGESIAKYLKELDDKINKGTLNTPPANEPKPTVNKPAIACCGDPKHKPVHGTGEFGPWSGIACDNCAKICFKKKDGSFGEWKPGKKKGEGF